MTKSQTLLLVKKILSILIIALMAIVGMSIFEPAEAVEQDKAYHATASAGIAYVASRHYDDVYSPFLLTSAIGIAKEATDTRFDRNDMSANMIGAAFGVMAGNQARILPSWSTTDKRLMQSYAWMNVLDILQTRKCLTWPNCEEMNPLIGSHPSNTALVTSKLVGTGAVYWLADTFENERTPLLWAVNAIQFVVVGRNHIEMRF